MNEDPTDEELREVARFAASLDPEVVRRLYEQITKQGEACHIPVSSKKD